MANKHSFSLFLGALAFGLLLLVACTPVFASTETVVHSFRYSDGDGPRSGLIGDSAGNRYGTTEYGGISDSGTVYKITSQGVLTTLHSFTGSTDGAYPYAGVTLGKDGNFYGTTPSGGAHGYGTVYKITPSGQETVLYSFTGINGDGQYPYAGVIQPKDGNFYGTTEQGGTADLGTVYQITPTGKETTLHSFAGSASGDGSTPYAGLLQAKDGNFYGTTYYGGVSGRGEIGTVYKITPTGQETVLYSFTYNGDGAFPVAGLIQAKDGNLYGTTTEGGTNGDGAVYQITPTGQETVLYAFSGKNTGDGSDPQAAVIQGRDGNLYGTTSSGGSADKGTVYQVTLTGLETVLHAFGSANGDGRNPYAPLIEDKIGHLYGTTNGGGASGDGTIFRITL